MIDHGLCPPGPAAGEFMTVENLTVETGRLPINTAGGNIAEGFVHGIGLVAEAVRQIRGGSPNPVADAEYLTTDRRSDGPVGEFDGVRIACDGVTRGVRMAATIGAALNWWARTKGDETALIVGEQQLTYRELHDWSGRWRAHSRERGIEPGDRVGCWPHRTACSGRSPHSRC